MEQQLGFPVKDNTPNRKTKDFHLISGISMNITPSVSWIGTYGTAQRLYVPQNMRVNLNNLEISVDKDCWINVKIYLPYSLTQLGMNQERIKRGHSNETTEFDFGGIELIENVIIEVKAAPISPAVAPIALAITGDFQMKSIDTNIAAKNYLEVIGDSITWSAAGVSSLLGTGTLFVPAFGWEYWTTKVQNKYLQEGFSLQKGTRSFGGCTSRNMVTLLRSEKPSAAELTIISLGMNDCSNNQIPVNEYITNHQEIISLIRQANPKGTILLIAPTSASEATRAPNIAAYRTALQNMFVNTYSGQITGNFGYSAINKIIFVDGSAAYPVGSSMLLPDGIHPNIDGQNAIANLIIPVLDASPWDIIK